MLSSVKMSKSTIPLKLFESRARMFRFFRLDIEAGTDPFRLFSLKKRNLNWDDEIFCTIKGPEILFEFKERISREGIAKIPQGMAPLNEL